MSHITYIKKNKNFWKNKKVLVTGHTGFKGSWLVIIMKFLGAKVYGLSLKPEQNSLFKIANLKKYVDSSFGDLKNYVSTKKKIEAIKPDYIFHFAAQSLVSVAHQNPRKTLMNNYEITLNMLDIFQEIKNIKSILITTTDKVYKDQGDKKYKENDILQGHESYSVSKVATEHIIDFYRDKVSQENNQRKIFTVRSGNVIGGGDWSKDRIIPDVINAWRKNKNLNVRNPNFNRPWMHVLDTLFGYISLIMQVSNKKNNYIYNFGPKKNTKFFTVLDLVKYAKTKFKEFGYVLKKTNKFHETKNLFLDSNLAKRNLSYQQKWDINKSLEFTFNWYKKYYLGSDPVQLCERDIKSYLS